MSSKPGKDKHDKPHAVRPLRKKVPEPPGNLRKRAEWFKKRAG